MRQDDIVPLIKQFIRVLKNKYFFLLMLLLVFFLPGENFYEKLRLRLNEPMVRQPPVQLPPIFDYPLKKTEETPPFLTARAVMVVDVPSKVVIFEKNAGLPLPPASTTKMMTALVSLENYQLDDVFVVPSLKGYIGQRMDLEEGEELTVESLLYGLLVQSANDAALTLAVNHPQGRAKFIEAMNQKAEDLGLNNTRFANISGLDRADHYSTVRDLAHLAAYAMGNPVFAKMVSLSRVTISDVDNQHQHVLENTNELIGKVSGLKGVKTGWTEAAGECLVSYIERNGRQIITVLLGSQNRFGETEKLAEWVFRNFEWGKIIQDNHS